MGFKIMKRIKLLDKNLINQIAAGEVIERPASVVKELVENSIDSGATRISVEINNDCRNIRIADNGSGIHKEDIELAFSRHATSKIQSEKDLWNINTLGFRGEALASVISIAKVLCTTKTKDSDTGYKAECENSAVKISETGCAQGTIMEIKDLFYNIPARLKFLKKSNTEFAYIQEIMQSLAISHPEIAFTLSNKGTVLLKTSGSSDIETVISEIYSKELVKELSIIKADDEAAQMSVFGVTSSPEYTRSNKKAIYVYINGRTVRCSVISKAIEVAYKDLISDHRYPFAVINLKMKPDEVDVNVHPSKKEVRYTNTNLIYGFIYSAVKNTLEKNMRVYSQPVKNFDSGFLPESKQNDLNGNQNSFVFEKTDFQKFKEIYDDNTVDHKQTALAIEETLPTQYVQKFKVIGQFKNTYIMVEDEEGLQIVDQHIAHERYLYELLKEKAKNQDIASQLLFMSDVIDLEPSEISLLQENALVLEHLGYKIEFLNENEVIFKQIPQIIAGKQPEKIIKELLEALKGSLDNLENEILITTACHAAIKAGEKLSIWQMEDLLEKWSTCKSPQTCPHGRKISHIVPIKNIAGFFGRTV
jgi:DNA mismatch repair protein MutL